MGVRDAAHPAPLPPTSQLCTPALPNTWRANFLLGPVYMVLVPFLYHYLLRCSVKFIKEAKYFLIACLYSLTFK